MKLSQILNGMIHKKKTVPIKLGRSININKMFTQILYQYENILYFLLNFI